MFEGDHFQKENRTKQDRWVRFEKVFQFQIEKLSCYKPIGATNTANKPFDKLILQTP